MTTGVHNWEGRHSDLWTLWTSAELARDSGES